MQPIEIYDTSAPPDVLILFVFSYFLWLVYEMAVVVAGSRFIGLSLLLRTSFLRRDPLYIFHVFLSRNRVVSEMKILTLPTYN